MSAMTNKLLAVQNAIATQVAAITSASAAYNFDLNGAMQYGVPTVDAVVGRRPEVFLSDIEETNLMRSGPVIRKRLNFTLVGITGTEIRFDDLGTDSVKLGADIEKAILTDQTLGGVVDTAVPVSTDINYFSEASKGMVAVSFYVEYPVTIGTP